MSTRLPACGGTGALAYHKRYETTPTKLAITRCSPAAPIPPAAKATGPLRAHRWLNELPALHPAGKTNKVLIHPADAAALGIADGDRVRLFSPVAAIELTASLSDRPRRGLVVVDHGWGSRIFDPRGGGQPESYGVNRNLLVESGPVDPLSQTAALSGAYVGMERV